MYYYILELVQTLQLDLALFERKQDSIDSKRQYLNGTYFVNRTWLKIMNITVIHQINSIWFGKRRHWDPARIQTWVLWIPVRCSYQLSHWSSGIRAEDRWHLSIDTIWFSGWIPLRLGELCRISTEVLCAATSKLGKSLVATIMSKTLNTQCRKEVRKWSAENHSNKLRQLSVQSKALAIVELEDANQVWKRILQGLSAGQLSFLLRAGTDTLPTPLNLRLWQ